ncbi:MAG: nucleotidyltransferase family protein [Bacteroidales bacterium]|nr:nucleotidyltransferase family protein [Bacteroidales bacterium]
MTDKRNITVILRENKSRLVKKYHLVSIGVFGSFTRDDFNDSSDIDILIEYEQPMGIEFIDLANELENLLKCPVDLVSRNGIKPKYYKEIQKDLVYV